MTTQEAIALIANPGQINAQHAEGLEELVNRYPWFSTGHILLAKAYKNAGRHSYRSLLKKASLYAGDRTLLFALMESPADRMADEVTVSEEAVPDATVIERKEETTLETERPAEENLAETPATNGEREAPKEIITPNEGVEKSSGHAIEDFLRSFGVDPLLVEEDAPEEEVKTDEAVYSVDNEDVDTFHPATEELEEEPSDAADDAELEEAIPFKTRGLTTDDEGEEAVDAKQDHTESTETRSTEIIYNPLKELGSLIPEMEDESPDREHLIFNPVYNPEVELARYIESKVKEEEGSHCIPF